MLKLESPSCSISRFPSTNITPGGWPPGEKAGVRRRRSYTPYQIVKYLLPWSAI
jgi:hypothetical protein